jgi:hypothetical protein
MMDGHTFELVNAGRRIIFDASWRSFLVVIPQPDHYRITLSFLVSVQPVGARA